MSDALEMELCDAQNIVTKTVIRQILNLRCWKNCLLEGRVWFSLNRHIRSCLLLFIAFLDMR